MFNKINLIFRALAKEPTKLDELLVMWTSQNRSAFQPLPHPPPQWKMEGTVSKTNYSSTPPPPGNSVGREGAWIFPGTAQWQIKAEAFPRSSRKEGNLILLYVHVAAIFPATSCPFCAGSWLAWPLMIKCDCLT